MHSIHAFDSFSEPVGGCCLNRENYLSLSIHRSQLPPRSSKPSSHPEVPNQNTQPPPRTSRATTLLSLPSNRGQRPITTAPSPTILRLLRIISGHPTEPSTLYPLARYHLKVLLCSPSRYPTGPLIPTNHLSHSHSLILSRLLILFSRGVRGSEPSSVTSLSQSINRSFASLLHVRYITLASQSTHRSPSEALHIFHYQPTCLPTYLPRRKTLQLSRSSVGYCR